MSIKKADYILKGDKVIYPKMPDEGLELFYGIKGKSNQGIRKNTILDMSGNRRDGILTGFDFDVASGYANGLVFDLEDDTLTRPVIPGLNPDNLTFQVNSNILRFNPDGTSQTVRDGLLTEIGRNLMKGSANFLLYSNNHVIYPVQIENLGTHRRIRRDPDFATSPRPEFSIYSPYFVPTVVGEIYVQSLDVRPEKDVLIRMFNSDNVLCRAGVWTRLTSPAKAAGSESTRTSAFIIDKEFGPNFNPWIEYRNAKFERGEVATPWTPAPEDIIGSVAYRDNMLGDLEDVVDDMDINKISGESVTVEGMKDNHLDVLVEGNTVQASDWYMKEGESSQYTDTKALTRNIIDAEKLTNVTYLGGGSFQARLWAGGIMSNSLVKSAFKPSTRYHYKVTYRLDTLSSLPLYQRTVGFNLYSSATGSFTFGYDTNLDVIGKISTVTGSFTTPADLADKSLIFYSNRYVSGGMVELDTVTVTDFIISEADIPYEPYKDAVKQGLVVDFSGRNFFNYPQTTTLKDRSGNGNDGTASGFSYNSTSGSDGNGGIVFDGVDDKMKIEGLFDINTFSVEAVFQLNSLSSLQYLINMNESGGIGDKPIIFYSASAKQMGFWTGSNNYFNPGLRTGEYIHVSAVKAGDTTSVFLNGIKINTISDSRALPATSVIWISSSGNPFNGSLRSFKFYNRALSASEVYQNYMAGVNLSMPSPEDPSPIVPNLPAGTYKYTSTDGIYEFTLDEGLHGIGDVKDMVTFDRVSGKGFLERKVSKKVFNGTEAWNWQGINVPGSSGYYISMMGWDFDTSINIYKGTLCSHMPVAKSGTGGVVPNSTSPNGFYTNWLVNIESSVAGMTVDSYKAWLAAQFESGTPFILHYVKSAPTRTPLTFTRVASSRKPEVPMQFLTSTPSLEYPAQVWDSEGGLEVRGKNLFDQLRTPDVVGQYAVSGYGSSNYHKLTNGYKIENRWSAIGFDFSLAPNTQCTISADLKFTGANSGSLHMTVNKYSGSAVENYSHKSYPQATYANQRVSFTFYSNSQSSGNIIAFNTNSNQGTDPWAVEITNIQLEEGSVATPYEPYISPASLPFPVLRRIGDVADTYDVSTGTVTRRTGMIRLDGSEGFGTKDRHTSTSVFFLNVPGQKAGSGSKLSYSHGKFFGGMYSTDGWVGLTSWSGQNTALMFAVEKSRIGETESDTNAQAVANFKAWVQGEFSSGTPLEVAYILDTPVTEKLPRNLIKAYYPTTVLETDSPNYCKPTLNTTVKSLDYLKETRTVNNILIWNRALGDEELISQNKLFHERYHIRSDTYNGIPINEYLNLNGGIPMNTTLALDITMTI